MNLESAGAANTTFLVVEAVQPGSTDNATNEVVGFVEVTSTREHCFVLAADVPYREYRSKITSLVVETAHRRQGVASLLLAACAKQCQIWSGHTELFLEIRSENHGARQFYEKMGFHQCVGKSCS
jgi:ribosomal protein S18 acetylase RimI-like enzyme